MCVVIGQWPYSLCSLYSDHRHSDHTKLRRYDKSFIILIDYNNDHYGHYLETIVLVVTN